MEDGQLSENLNNMLAETTHNRAKREMYTCETFQTNYGHKTMRYWTSAFHNTLLPSSWTVSDTLWCKDVVWRKKNVHLSERSF